MDKFERASIYDVDWKTMVDGEELVFTFKPLPFNYYPKLYDFMNKLDSSGLLKGLEGLSDEEQAEKIMSGLDSELMGLLIDLEKAMVSQSYPEKEELLVERFVMSNSFELMEPLISLMNRQEKANPRKVSAARG